MIVVFAIVIEPHSPKIRSSGLTTPSSSAAAAMMILKVEPGSNGSDTARLRISSFFASANVLGLNVGRIATARTSPVFGSITTAMAALLLVRRYAASISRSATYCILVSSVSITP